MGLGVVNLDELEYEEFDGGVRFAADWGDISRRIGGRKLGAGHWIVPAGKVSVPYHAHLVNEELALVLGGQLHVRLDGGEHALGAGDLVAFPPGRDSAHQFLNRSDGPANLLLVSTMIEREVVDYPDSGKRMISVGGLATDPPRLALRIQGDRVLPAGDEAYLAGEPEEPLGAAAEVAGERDPRIVRVDEVPWEPYALGAFRAGRRRLARAAGALRLGYSLYRVAPGDRMWPYHFQHVNEELFFVRRGYAELRTTDGARDLRPGDFVLCPPGPGGAHGLRNTGDAPLDVLAVSTMEEPEISEYPDSGKIYVLVGAPPGGDASDRAVDLLFRRDDAVDYLDGER